MRSNRIIVALAAVAICALSAFASPAFAAKEKKVFGEFEAHVTGKNLETEPQPIQIDKEDEPEITGLQLGNYKFGPIIKTGPNAGKPDLENPCLKPPKITGDFKAEEGKVNRSNSIILKIAFKQCIARAQENGVVKEKKVSFTLGVKLEPNFSAEVGKSESGLEIEPATLSFKGPLAKCVVTIPRQTIPAKDNPEHEYEEIVSYTNESEEPEKFETSKKVKELYPSGLKERIEVELEEKFKGIHAYVSQEHGCTSSKGEESPKEVTEGPFAGQLEYTSGHIFGDFEGVEIKNGNLTFVEPI